MLNAPVLVLNQNYEALNVCDIRRAFRLLGAEKAELIARNHQVIHTVTRAFDAPSVIRLVYLVKRPSRGSSSADAKVFARDRHTCQVLRDGDPRPDHRPRRAAPPGRPA